MLLVFFSETRFSHLDDDTMCAIDNYTLFRNDDNTSNSNVRPFSGTAMYSQIDFYPGNPYSSNSTGVEITVIRCKDCSTCTYIWNMPLTSCAIGTIFPEII